MAKNKGSDERRTANQNGRAISWDNDNLSRTDRFFIASMLGDGFPSHMSLSEETIIGGASLGSIMELGFCELYSDLKLADHDPIQALQIAQLLNLQKIAWGCFDQARNVRARDIDLRYAFKATDTFIQLYDRLASRWAEQNSIPLGERVVVPLTANTLVDGIRLRDKPNKLVDGVALDKLMEECRVELYLTLKPQDPFESILADLIVRTHKGGRDCFHQADLWPQPFREVNLKYALKGVDSSARLLARLEDYRVKKIERLQNSATGGRVASSKLDRECKKQDKARVH